MEGGSALMHFPPPQICIPAVCQSDGSIHRLTSQTDLDEERGAPPRLFNAPSAARKSRPVGRDLEY